MITQRDVKIMMFINQFGFSTTSIIKALLFDNANTNSARVITRRRINALYELDLLKGHKNIIGYEDVFTLTAKGSNLLEDFGNSKVTSMIDINWVKFNHDTEVQKVYIRFRALGYGRFYSDRVARVDKPFGELFPDLIIFRNDNSLVMIEVELTQKSNKRLKDKLALYKNCPYQVTLLYLCGSTTITKQLNLQKGDDLDLFALDIGEFYQPSTENFIHKLMQEKCHE